MNNSRRFQFGQSNNLDPMNRVADLFDIQYNSKGSQAQWEQEVRGVLSKYRTNEQIPNTPDKETRDVTDIQYMVVGHDEFLIEQRKKQNLKTDRKTISAVVNAKDLLVGSLAIEVKPEKYIDEFGNVFKKINGGK